MQPCLMLIMFSNSSFFAINFTFFFGVWSPKTRDLEWWPKAVVGLSKSLIFLKLNNFTKYAISLQLIWLLCSTGSSLPLKCRTIKSSPCYLEFANVQSTKNQIVQESSFVIFQINCIQQFNLAFAWQIFFF